MKLSVSEFNLISQNGYEKGLRDGRSSCFSSLHRLYEANKDIDVAEPVEAGIRLSMDHIRNSFDI